MHQRKETNHIEQQKLTITVKELAAQLNISMPKAYEMTEIEGFPLIRLGKKKLVNAARLQGFLDKLSGIDMKYCC